MRLFDNIANRIAGEVFDLSSDNAKHIYVMRLRLSETLTVCDGFGNDCACELTETSKNEAKVRILSITKNISEPGTQITLYQSLLKDDKMELLIQKSIELGVCRIAPIETVHSVARLSNPIHKQERLQRIAESAAKQCGRGIIPEVILPDTLTNTICKLDCKLNLFAHEKSTEALLPLLRHNNTPDISDSIGLFIGPEGGFSEEESRNMQAKGIHPFSLGKRILRAETAGFFAVGLINYLTEDSTGLTCKKKEVQNG